MKIKKEIAQELVYSQELDGFKVIERSFIEKTRWALAYRMILEKEGKFYSTSYRRAATESQEERAFEYEPEEIDLIEVYPEEKTITIYVARPTTVTEEK